jgi:hypothetical protein
MLMWMILIVTLAEYMYDMVYFLFQLEAFRIQNVQRAHVYSGTDYTFPVLF